MVSTLVRAMLVACVLLVVPEGAGAAEAVDGYKPPSAARQSPQPAASPEGRQGQPARKSTGAGAQKTIGLISVIGDRFMVKTVGMTVFGNEEREVPIANWKIDDRVAAKIGTLLARNFKIRRIAVPAGTYGKYETALKGTDYRERRRKLMVDFASQQKCDFYVLIAPGGSMVGSTNQGVGGLGVLRWKHLLSPGEHVFALSEITAYDSQFKAVRTENGSIGQDTFFMVVIRGPHLLLEDGKKLPEAPEAAASDPRAKELIWGLLEKSLAMTVPKLFAVD
jgi:hypothetical protein